MANKPNNPSLWSKAKSLARQKFDVYPCVPMDSQALTKEGWKYYHELNVGDEILAHNIESNINEWTPIIALQKFENAPIIRLFKKQTNFDIKCTPNHKWVLDEENSKYPDHLVEAKNITKHMQIRTSAVLGQDNEPLELLTFFKKDNWVKNILKMAISQVQSFFASGIVYDGHDKGLSKDSKKQTYGFSQKDINHGLAMEIAATLLGYRVCSAVKKENQTMRTWTFIRRTFESTQNLYKEDAGTADVWCPTTKYGTWVMKQNGYVTITGNSAYANGWAAKYYKSKGGTWRKAQMGMYTMAEGGVNNPGFKALPGYVQAKIKANMQGGGMAMGNPMMMPVVEERVPVDNKVLPEVNIVGEKPSMLRMLTSKLKRKIKEGIKVIKDEGYYSPFTSVDNYMGMTTPGQMISFSGSPNNMLGNTTPGQIAIPKSTYGGQFGNTTPGQLVEFKKGGMPDRYKKMGFRGVNQPKRTPGASKSHAVVTKVGGNYKLIRFGQQGVSGSPKKEGESASYRKRRESFKARHAKNIAKGKSSAAYWANKVKW